MGTDVRVKLRFTICVFLVLFMMTPSSYGNPQVKEPNVSGTFYSSDPDELSRDVEGFIAAASVRVRGRIEVLIAPHAGYMYSGPVAGTSYKAVSGRRYKTIVILAPSHYFGFQGVSVWTSGGLKTPLGIVAVDEDFSRKLVAMDGDFYFKPEVFEKEHSLEVQLPFLQKTFEDFKIVPIIMGQPTFENCQNLAAAFDQLIGTRDDVLIVVSTDMSHYHSDAAAREMDQDTLAAVKDLRARDVWQKCHIREMEMCGFVPVTTAMLYAEKRGLSAEILQYANSGDTSGDRDRVVGYSSMIFYKDENAEAAIDSREKQGSDIPPLTSGQKDRLLKIARTSIVNFVREGTARGIPEILEIQKTDPRLMEPEGAFVSIYNNGRLRGCIGNVIGRGPLYKTVSDMAVASASQDIRFAPVSSNELDEIAVEISVLSQPRQIRDTGEIKLGTHGVIVSRGTRLGVFLPQVADETGWSREEFLSNLCAHKAGLPPDCWKDLETKIEIFSADVFWEKGFDKDTKTHDARHMEN